MRRSYELEKSGCRRGKEEGCGFVWSLEFERNCDSVKMRRTVSAECLFALVPDDAASSTVRQLSASVRRNNSTTIFHQPCSFDACFFTPALLNSAIVLPHSTQNPPLSIDAPILSVASQYTRLGPLSAPTSAMPSLSSIAYYASHPNELRAIIQWHVYLLRFQFLKFMD